MGLSLDPPQPKEMGIYRARSGWAAPADVGREAGRRERPTQEEWLFSGEPVVVKGVIEGRFDHTSAP